MGHVGHYDRYDQLMMILGILMDSQPQFCVDGSGSTFLSWLVVRKLYIDPAMVLGAAQSYIITNGLTGGDFINIKSWIIVGFMYCSFKTKLTVWQFNLAAWTITYVAPWFPIIDHQIKSCCGVQLVILHNQWLNQPHYEKTNLLTAVADEEQEIWVVQAKTRWPMV